MLDPRSSSIKTCRGAEGERQHTARALRERPKDRGIRFRPAHLPIQRGAFHVANDADNGEPRPLLAGCSQSDPLADRHLAAEVPPGQDRVHDGHRLRFSSIVSGERASLDDRNFVETEVAGADGVIRRPPLGQSGMARYLDLLTGTPTEGRVGTETGTLKTGDARESVLEAPVELNHPSLVRVALSSQAYPGV